MRRKSSMLKRFPLSGCAKSGSCSLRWEREELASVIDAGQ